jgi:hypothetical protein
MFNDDRSKQSDQPDGGTFVFGAANTQQQQQQQQLRLQPVLCAICRVSDTDTALDQETAKLMQELGELLASGIITQEEHDTNHIRIPD